MGCLTKLLGILGAMVLAGIGSLVALAVLIALIAGSGRRPEPAPIQPVTLTRPLPRLARAAPEIARPSPQPPRAPVASSAPKPQMPMVTSSPAIAAQAVEERETELVPKFRINLTRGDAVFALFYVKIGTFIHATDLEGKVTQHFEKSVKSIEPLSYQEGRAALALIAKLKLGVMALSQARAEAKRKPDPPPRPPPPPAATVSSGYPSGTQIGPRGGTFHYTKSGKKDYHKR